MVSIEPSSLERSAMSSSFIPESAYQHVVELASAYGLVRGRGRAHLVGFLPPRPPSGLTVFPTPVLQVKNIPGVDKPIVLTFLGGYLALQQQPLARTKARLARLNCVFTDEWRPHGFLPHDLITTTFWDVVFQAADETTLPPHHALQFISRLSFQTVSPPGAAPPAAVM